MKAILVAAASAALLVSVPAQAADGFNFLLGGSTWRVPHCAAPKVLRELRDPQSGRTVWRCVAVEQQTAQATLPAPRR